MKTFAVVGCGHLGRIILEAYYSGLLPGYRMIAVFSRNKEESENLIKDNEAVVVSKMEDLLDLRPDFIIETASIALLKTFAIPALERGISIIPLSIGAFADQDFLNATIETAKKTGAKIHIPGGAVGGFDVLSTISLISKYEKTDIKAGIQTHKGPGSLKNTVLYSTELENKEKTVFSGTTKEAIAILPTKVNVAVASSLTTVGPEKASASITSVPGFIGDDHRIEVETKGVKAILDIYSATSDIAAWSAVALLRNLESPMQFF